MKQILAGLLVFAAFGVVACGDDDKGDETATPKDACRSTGSVLCSKVWGGCIENPAGAPALWGNSEADCRTKYELNTCSDAQVDCGTKTYSQANAQECIDQYRAMSCDQLKKLVPPAACGAKCQ